MIRALLLDADGVVIHPYRFARYLAQEHGITREMTAPFFRGVFEECLAGRADLRQVLPPFLLAWRWPGTLDEFVQTWLDVENAPDEAVIEIVRSIRASGILCGLATSQEHYRAAYMARQMRFAEIFDRLFFSSDLGYVKPDRAYFEAITAALKQPPSGILFWDDDRANVEAARQAGWQAEVYDGVESFRRRLADYGCG